MPLEKTLKVLSENDINEILSTAYDINENIGMSVDGKRLGYLLVKNGASEDKGRVKLPADLISRCLDKSPGSFFFHDRSSNSYTAETGRTYLGTMSDAIEILDSETQMTRSATLQDLVDLTKIARQFRSCLQKQAVLYPSLTRWKRS